ncbi:MAG: ABC-F family ATP-binding cassette domain-containing protein [Cuneatibacter sp.]|nr:ABC-F family ATP-binding cassette domain-containing protein [Cuneatibacter sp.]
MILACSHIHKAFIEKTIIEDATFHIEEREKAAIVGINGAGKSTLLKIIMGELAADSGEVMLAKGKTIGYLAQHQALQEGRTIYEEILEMKRDVLELEQRIRRLEREMKDAEGEELTKLLESYSRATHEFEQADGYAVRSEVTGVLRGLGFTEEEFDKDVGTLSGGQKTRVSLSKLLLSKPDVILLDEPTNHLDMDSVAWLENFLLNYNGSVIVVAHDRYFLDKIVTKVIEIDRCQVRTYRGNYTDYYQKKKAMLDIELKAYYNQQREIKHQEEVIARLKSFNREKSIKRAESREKALAKVEVLDKPITQDVAMTMELSPRNISGNDVLQITGLSKAFGDQQLFTDVTFEIKRGERLAVIGKNGTGKTTLLKIINGLLQPDTGEIKLGSRVQIAYYDQEHHVLHSEKTVFEEMSDAYPTLTNTEIRNVLAAFLFTGEDVFKQISELSGGEKGRVSLAKLMLSEANFLILDEPTNHLDILSKEILEQALNRYTGTVLYVSHDRYFINQTATRVLELSEQEFTSYLGNYDYYVEKKTQQAYLVEEATKKAVESGEVKVQPVKAPVKVTALDWKQQKEEQARLRKRQNDLKKVEDAIAALEARLEEIDALLGTEDVYTNVAKLLELNKEKEEKQAELEADYEQWEALAAEE